jgi:4-amino-4-deoxy-L-arabinose transferase-like glycosyltransferase
MVVSVLMSGALACFILAIQEPPGKMRRGLFYGLYACAALATLSKGLIGFLVPGAIMFLWLLGGNQWRRLRPFYLPTGTLVFLGLAAPWHVIAALRNADWAQFYFIHEHWLRYTTSVHDRVEPWWYFVPVVIFGFFPWIGFLPRAVRSAWSKGDADKRERAKTGFLLTWAGFIFVFFSLSSSKLAPYVLPMFPPLALLVGRWLARRLPQDKRTGGMAIFAGLALTLGLAVVLVVSRAGGPIDAELLPQARPFLFLAAAALFVGALVVSLAGWRVTRLTISAVVATIMVLTVSLELLAPQLIRPGTKVLSGFFLEHRQAGDKIYHYRNFFHDFTYYTKSLVGTVDYTGELELQIDPNARDSGRYIDDATFREEWAGDGRVWVLVYHKKSADLLGDPLFQDCVVAESPGYVLLCNRPPDSLNPSTHESSGPPGP